MKIGRTDEGQITDVSLRILRKGWSAIQYLHVLYIYIYKWTFRRILVRYLDLITFKAF